MMNSCGFLNLPEDYLNNHFEFMRFLEDYLVVGWFGQSTDGWICSYM